MARVFARPHKQVIGIVTVTRREVLTWLPAHSEKAYRGIRALQCPRCHATCQQLYLVTFREALFVCFKCSKLPHKPNLESPTDPVVADLVREHYSAVRAPQNENEPSP